MPSAKSVLADVRAFERSIGWECPMERFAAAGDSGTHRDGVLVSVASVDTYRRAWEHAHAMLDLVSAAKGRVPPLNWDGGLYYEEANAATIRAGLLGQDATIGARVAGIVDELLPELPPLPSRRRRRVWSDDGSDYDFDRLQDFHERPASARKRTVRSDPGTVHLVASTGFPNSSSRDALNWTGAPAVAVAKALLLSGYSVTLDVARSVDRNAGLCRSMEVVRVMEAGTSHETDDAAIAAVACWDRSVSSIGWMHRRIALPLGTSAIGTATRNPARDYIAVAKQGLLPMPTWAFDMAFNRQGALDSARNGLRAVIDQIDPEIALDTRAAWEIARDAMIRSGS